MLVKPEKLPPDSKKTADILKKSLRRIMIIKWTDKIINEEL
jgi:hypothetical protein